MASQQVLSALESLHQEMEKLQPAIKHVEMAQQVTDSLKSIPSLHAELLKTIQKEDESFKKQLSETTGKALLAIKEENSLLANSTAGIQEAVKNEQKYLAELKDRVESYYNTIERISFPDRLDKLDNSVSANMLALQSFQNRLENLERNLADRIKEGIEQQKRTSEALLKDLTARLNGQQKSVYITWGLMVALAALVFFLLKK